MKPSSRIPQNTVKQILLINRKLASRRESRHLHTKSVSRTNKRKRPFLKTQLKSTAGNDSMEDENNI